LPKNHEQGNVGVRNIWVDLNGSRDNSKSELIQAARSLREE
jgi:hypothetical protein